MTDQEINDAQRRDAEMFSEHLVQVDDYADRLAHRIHKMYDGLDAFTQSGSTDTIDMDGKFTVAITVRCDTGNTELEFSLPPHSKYVLPRLDDQTLRSCLHRMMFMKF